MSLTTKDFLAIEFLLSKHLSKIKDALNVEDESEDGEDINDMIHYEAILDKVRAELKSSGT